MKPTVDTLARTLILVLALINQVISSLGFLPLQVDEQSIYQFISLAFTAAAALAAWWKNNSFTEHAIKADEYGRELKSGNHFK